MCGDHSVLVHDHQAWQVVAAADLEVVRVVRRGDLHRAGAELRVDMLVGDHRDAAAGQRQLDLGADQVGVALVVGVHRDGGVAEHRLRPGGGDHEGVVAVAVADGDQLAVVVCVLHLDVGQRGETARAPVDDPLGAVDQPVVVQPLEHRADSPGQSLVHGEPLAGPVDRVAEPAHLAEDLPPELGLPLPHPLHERVPAEVVAGQALLGELAFDDVLGGDAGVVHAGQPQGVEALHPAPADEDVLDGVVERVAHVQGAGDVRRRDDEGVGRGVGLAAGGEVAALDPPLVEGALHLGRNERLRKFGRGLWPLRRTHAVKFRDRLAGSDHAGTARRTGAASSAVDKVSIPVDAGTGV